MTLNFFKKTYHFFSALTLMLFLSSIVLPAGVAAAGLFCNMEMAGTHGNMKQCCDVHETDAYGEAVLSSGTSDCKTQQICAHDGIENDLQIEATVPQLPTDMAAVAIEAYHERIFSDDKPVSIPDFQSTLPYSQPPLFLLNSTFLN